MKREILEKVYNTRKSIIVEGDIASGKTTNVLFPIVNNIIDNGENLFILDSKEEYLNIYYNKLKENNYNTIIINLRDVNKSEGWNPLEYPYMLYKNGDKDKAQEYLEKIGKVIFYDDSSADPFWSITASNYFTGLALGLFEDGKIDEVNLNSINNMFNYTDKKYGSSDYITEYFKIKGETSMPYAFASSTVFAPKETKGSIISVARQKLRVFISREILSEMMSKTTFSYNNIVNNKTAIFVIARDESKTLNSIAAMFIEQLYAVLVDLKSINKFNLVLDNFDNIEKCNEIVNILSSCSSRNIKTYIGTRSSSELGYIYGEYILKLCDLLSIGNSSIKLVINNEEEIVDKEFDEVIIPTSNVLYPVLERKEVKLFNLEKFIMNIKGEQLGEMPTPPEIKKIDEIIKNIDEKISQLEMEEALDKAKKSNDVSSFDQFKINE